MHSIAAKEEGTTFLETQTTVVIFQTLIIVCNNIMI